jgi:hypothetical protein
MAALLVRQRTQQRPAAKRTLAANAGAAALAQDEAEWWLPWAPHTSTYLQAARVARKALHDVGRQLCRLGVQPARCVAQAPLRRPRQHKVQSMAQLVHQGADAAQPSQARLLATSSAAARYGRRRDGRAAAEKGGEGVGGASSLCTTQGAGRCAERQVVWEHHSRHGRQARAAGQAAAMPAESGARRIVVSTPPATIAAPYTLRAHIHVANTALSVACEATRPGTIPAVDSCRDATLSPPPPLSPPPHTHLTMLQ